MLSRHPNISQQDGRANRGSQCQVLTDPPPANRPHSPGRRFPPDRATTSIPIARTRMVSGYPTPSHLRTLARCYRAVKTAAGGDPQPVSRLARKNLSRAFYSVRKFAGGVSPKLGRSAHGTGTDPKPARPQLNYDGRARAREAKTCVSDHAAGFDRSGSRRLVDIHDAPLSSPIVAIVRGALSRPRPLHAGI